MFDRSFVVDRASAVFYFVVRSSRTSVGNNNNALRSRFHTVRTTHIRFLQSFTLPKRSAVSLSSVVLVCRKTYESQSRSSRRPTRKLALPANRSNDGSRTAKVFPALTSTTPNKLRSRLLFGRAFRVVVWRWSTRRTSEKYHLNVGLKRRRIVLFFCLRP